MEQVKEASMTANTAKTNTDQNTHVSLEQTQNAWLAFQNQAHIKRPETEAEYLKLHALLDDLTNRYAMDDAVFGSLIDLIARYILMWENANDSSAQTPSTPRDALASLMRDRGTMQYQLEKAGVIAPSTLSQVLSGKREISKGAAKKLATFFGVSSSVFF
jgi:antitoxin component HigA of HigAB toxin-antitoxin module